MRKIIFILLLVGLVPYSVFAESIIDKVLVALDGYNPYKVEIEVIYGTNSISGYYEVDKSQYYISIGDQELYGDATVKYEVFNSRKEVIIDSVSPDYNGNLLINPATAFTSIKEYYNAEVIPDNQDITTIELKPIVDSGINEKIELCVSNTTLLPTLIIYSINGEEVLIKIKSITKLSSSFTSYDSSKYAEFEIIDFR